jgi:hypothetical protein
VSLIFKAKVHSAKSLSTLEWPLKRKINQSPFWDLIFIFVKFFDIWSADLNFLTFSEEDEDDELLDVNDLLTKSTYESSSTIKFEGV